MGSNTGATYFFYWENGQWVEKQKVYASDFATNSFFGRAIGIDGSACVIGAGSAATDANGANPVTGAGAAYVFELRSNGLWQEVEKLAGTNRNSNDLFGEAVDISGTSIVVGAWLADTLGGMDIIDGGAIYLYERDAALSIDGLKELSGINFFQQSVSQLGLRNTGPLNVPIHIQLTNLMGQTLYAEDIQLGASWSHEFSILPAGVYLLQVQSPDSRPLTWKWIKY
ncbi:MAG: T9SS type A sorting domain-containing protein [Bacteroidia bacterium]